MENQQQSILFPFFKGKETSTTPKIRETFFQSTSGLFNVVESLGWY